MEIGFLQRGEKSVQKRKKKTNMRLEGYMVQASNG